MRLTMLNAWGGRLYDRLLSYLADAAPDVLCLEEVVHTPDATTEWLTYRDAGVELPQRARLFEEVGAALPDHRAAFCPAATRGDLFDGEQVVPSEWGLATFVHRRLAVIGQVHDLVFRDFSPDGYGGHPRSRSAHVVRLFDYEGGFSITVAHMHGLRDPRAGKADTHERLVQVERFAAMIGALHRPNERLIICGDFNVLPGSETLAVLAGLGLTELVTSHGFQGTRTAFYDKPERFADYMLVSLEVEVRAFDVISDPAVSDHCALVLDVG